MLHGLLEDDLDHRFQFCEVVLNEERRDNGIIDKTTWSDEAPFNLSGAVNWHNCVYYSRDSPPVTTEGQLNQLAKCSLCGSFACQGTWTHFFHTTVTT